MRTAPVRRMLAATAILVTCITNSHHSAAQRNTEIAWDQYGVPHIYGSTINDMYYGLGWAQANNHANLLLQLYAQGRGRAAEYLGEKFLQGDILVRKFELPELSQKLYAQQKGDAKARLDAFVDGINTWMKVNTKSIDPALKPVLPITGADVLAHATRVIHLQFLAGADIGTVARNLAGSNAYAIAPSRSASGNAMLVANPHLPWSDFFTFFEAHLNGPDFNAYGTALVGQPTLNIAFNEHLGWTHTVNTIDASDRYELTLQDSGYLLDGKPEPFEKRAVVIQVKQPDGSLKPQDVTILKSKHGHVVGEKNGKAWAIRVAGMENPSMADQYHRMAAAKNLKEFEAALKMMQNPMFNVIYADKHGNILYLFNGNVPVRSEGDFRFWNGTVDGTASRLIWNKYHRYDELPRLLNPETGFVQNANDPPWTSTYPVALKPSDFPAYMAPVEMVLRPQRALNMIRDDKSITFNELVDYKLNTGMEAADRFLDDLLAAVKLYPDSLATAAAAVLSSWDRQTNPDSRGAVLFARWCDKVQPKMFKQQWNLATPVTTPDGLADPKQAVELLVKAAEETRSMHGSLDVPWGEVYRFRINGIDLPANGGSGNYGIFRTMYFRPANNKNYAWHGDTYVAVTEFGKKVKAKVLLSYGNASQPGSKHIGDQLQLLSEKKLRDALFYKEDVENHVVARESLP